MSAPSNPFANLPNFHERADGTCSASCPGPSHANGDKHPSLSAKWDGTKWLVHCWVGCSTDDIRKAMGLPWQAFFDDVLLRADSGKGRGHRHRAVEGVRQRQDLREWRESEMMQAATELRDRDHIIRLINNCVAAGKLSIDDAMEMLGFQYHGYSELEYRFETLRTGTSAQVEELWRMRDAV